VLEICSEVGICLLASLATISCSSDTSMCCHALFLLTPGYRQPLLYNLSVAREFFKQVYIREGLAPPTDAATIQSTYQTLFARARDLNYWRGIAQSGEWAKVGIYGLEAYFIFNIGEMIGRRHIVGYKVD
jgi:F-type H+-transporting ATPase subunit g